jgi:hypothetical protein
LKSSVDIRGIYAFVHNKLHHHTLSHARTNAVSAILINGLWTGPRHVRRLSVISAHLPLTTACSTSSGVPSNFFRVGVQQIQLRAERTGI